MLRFFVLPQSLSKIGGVIAFITLVSGFFRDWRLRGLEIFLRFA